MKRYGHQIIACLAGAILCSVSCALFASAADDAASSAVLMRKTGAQMYCQGFRFTGRMLPGEKISRRLLIEVHIVSSRDQIPYMKEREELYGCAGPKNDIWVIGNRTAAGVIVNELVLGHELLHLLNRACPVIVNPDELYGKILDSPEKPGNDREGEINE